MTADTTHAARVLAHLTARSGRLSPFGAVAAACGLAEDQLRPIVHDLEIAGLVNAVRGPGGGLRLARPAAAISLGEIVRHTESRLGADAAEGARLPAFEEMDAGARPLVCDRAGHRQKLANGH
jgi:Rrf2 family nitric oxide-sensitive transcriptional repressor